MIIGAENSSPRLISGRELEVDKTWGDILIFGGVIDKLTVGVVTAFCDGMGVF